MTTWVPCVQRREITRLEKDGSIGQIMRCAHIACSRFNTNLKPEDCAACPLRLITTNIRPTTYTERPIYNREYAEPRITPDGSMVYDDNGLKPPSVPEGYAKSDDAWKFLPLFPACPMREAANIVQRCGCIKTSAMCASKESNMHGLPVMPPVCEACPVRARLAAPQPPAPPDPN
jgi:hypothetical protein